MRSSDLKGHLHSMKIIESSACSCGFKNEDEIHFFLACPLYYRPRVTLLNALAHIAPLTVRHYYTEMILLNLKKTRLL